MTAQPSAVPRFCLCARSAGCLHMMLGASHAGSSFEVAAASSAAATSSLPTFNIPGSAAPSAAAPLAPSVPRAGNVPTFNEMSQPASAAVISSPLFGSFGSGAAASSAASVGTSTSPGAVTTCLADFYVPGVGISLRQCWSCSQWLCPADTCRTLMRRCQCALQTKRRSLFVV